MVAFSCQLCLASYVERPKPWIPSLFAIQPNPLCLYRISDPVFNTGEEFSLLRSRQHPRAEYLTMQHHQNLQRRSSLDTSKEHTPPPPPPPSNSVCRGITNNPAASHHLRMRHPLDFCTMRRPPQGHVFHGHRPPRAVQFADQQNNVSYSQLFYERFREKRKNYCA